MFMTLWDIFINHYLRYNNKKSVVIKINVKKHQKLMNFYFKKFQAAKFYPNFHAAVSHRFAINMWK